MPIEGHDKRCPFCGEKTNSVAANPGLWPVPLHSDQAGVVGWWHAGCAIDQIERAKTLEAALRPFAECYTADPPPIEGVAVFVPREAWLRAATLVKRGAGLELA